MSKPEIMFARDGYTVGQKIIAKESPAIRTEVTVTEITRDTITLTDIDGVSRVVRG